MYSVSFIAAFRSPAIAGVLARDREKMTMLYSQLLLFRSSYQRVEEFAEAKKVHKVHRAEVVVDIEWVVVQGLPWGCP